MTPGKYADSYELSAGLRDDTIATIQFATFRTDAGYNNGNTLLLVLTLTDENNEVFDQMLSIGADWISSDGGQTVQHAGGKTKFNRGSNYGKWLAACAELPELQAHLENTGPASDSHIWDGVKIHLAAHEETYTIQGETKTASRLLPDQFLGVEKTTGTSPSLTPPTVQPTIPAVQLTPQQILANAKSSSSPSAGAFHSQLTELAKSSDTHQDFLQRALAVDGVLADDDLVARLMDENDFYKSVRS